MEALIKQSIDEFLCKRKKRSTFQILRRRFFAAKAKLQKLDRRSPYGGAPSEGESCRFQLQTVIRNFNRYQELRATGLKEHRELSVLEDVKQLCNTLSCVLVNDLGPTIKPVEKVHWPMIVTKVRRLMQSPHVAKPDGLTPDFVPCTAYHGFLLIRYNCVHARDIFAQCLHIIRFSIEGMRLGVVAPLEIPIIFEDPLLFVEPFTNKNSEDLQQNPLFYLSIKCESSEEDDGPLNGNVQQQSLEKLSQEGQDSKIIESNERLRIKTELQMVNAPETARKATSDNSFLALEMKPFSMGNRTQHYNNECLKKPQVQCLISNATSELISESTHNQTAADQKPAISDCNAKEPNFLLKDKSVDLQPQTQAVALQSEQKPLTINQSSKKLAPCKGKKLRTFAVLEEHFQCAKNQLHLMEQHKKYTTFNKAVEQDRIKYQAVVDNFNKYQYLKANTKTLDPKELINKDFYAALVNNIEGQLKPVNKSYWPMINRKISIAMKDLQRPMPYKPALAFTAFRVYQGFLLIKFKTCYAKNLFSQCLNRESIAIEGMCLMAIAPLEVPEIFQDPLLFDEPFTDENSEDLEQNQEFQISIKCDEQDRQVETSLNDQQLSAEFQQNFLDLSKQLQFNDNILLNMSSYITRTRRPKRVRKMYNCKFYEVCKQILLYFSNLDKLTTAQKKQKLKVQQQIRSYERSQAKLIKNKEAQKKSLCANAAANCAEPQRSKKDFSPKETSQPAITNSNTDFYLHSLDNEMQIKQEMDFDDLGMHENDLIARTTNVESNYPNTEFSTNGNNYTDYEMKPLTAPPQNEIINLDLVFQKNTNLNMVNFLKTEHERLLPNRDFEIFGAKNSTSTEDIENFWNPSPPNLVNNTQERGDSGLLNSKGSREPFDLQHPLPSHELTIALIDRQQEDYTISMDAWRHMEKSLLQQLAEELEKTCNSRVGMFGDNYWHCGLKIIQCENMDSLNFLKRFMRSQSLLWPNAQYDVIPLDELTRRYIVIVWIPPPMLDDLTLIELLRSQNSTFYSFDWIIENSHESYIGNGKELYISISYRSFKKLQKNGWEIRFGTNRLKIFLPEVA